jgi:hypothetical protein
MSPLAPIAAEYFLAPDTLVFVMHLYGRALLNGAALRAVGCMDAISSSRREHPPGSTHLDLGFRNAAPSSRRVWAFMTTAEPAEIFPQIDTASLAMR